MPNKQIILISWLLLIFASLIYFFAGQYTNSSNNTQVNDIILDNIPSFDLSILYIWLYLPIIAIFIIYPLFFKPKENYYITGAFALFLIVRSFFIILTHLQIPANAILPSFPWIANNLHFTNDLFFSGHAGLAFLGFFLFKGKIKYFMLISSIILGITVLLMHIHYSIDVFAAYFISYGIYGLTKKIYNLK